MCKECLVKRANSKIQYGEKYSLIYLSSFIKCLGNIGKLFEIQYKEKYSPVYLYI